MDDGAEIHLEMKPLSLGDWNLIVAQIQFVVEGLGIKHVHADDKFTTKNIK